MTTAPDLDPVAAANRLLEAEVGLDLARAALHAAKERWFKARVDVRYAEWLAAAAPKAGERSST